jgi:hypothetical protein
LGLGHGKKTLASLCVLTSVHRGKTTDGVCVIILQGKYSGSRKNGNGVYSFINLDVYEGEFKEDRMAGAGVYTFYPEGR